MTQLAIHAPKRAANGELEHPICSEAKRRLEAEVRLARFVFAVTGEAMTGEEVDAWIAGRGAETRAEVGA